MSKQQTFSVQGMKCGHCVATATDALRKLPGFERADFDLEKGIGVVTGDVVAADVEQALTEAGYPASKQGD